MLALQGSFALHQAMLRRVGVEAVEVRKAPALDGLDGLIIPGGESSTMLKFLIEEDLFEPLRTFHERGGALYGTCAGAILLAREVQNPEQNSLALLDIEIQRNGYGRQLESHLGSAACSELGEPDIPVVMIRAPVISEGRSGSSGTRGVARTTGFRQGRARARDHFPSGAHAGFAYPQLFPGGSGRERRTLTSGGTKSRRIRS